MADAKNTIKSQFDKFEIWFGYLKITIDYDEAINEVGQMQTVVYSRDTTDFSIDEMKRLIAAIIENYKKQLDNLELLKKWIAKWKEEFDQKIKPLIDSGLNINEEETKSDFDLEILEVQTHISDIQRKFAEMSKIAKDKENFISYDINRLDDMLLFMEDATDEEKSP